MLVDSGAVRLYPGGFRMNPGGFKMNPGGFRMNPGGFRMDGSCYETMEVLQLVKCDAFCINLIFFLGTIKMAF